MTAFKRGDDGRAEETDSRNSGLSEAGDFVLRHYHAAEGPEGISFDGGQTMRPLRREESRSGHRDRSAGIYFWSGAGVPAGGGICSYTKAEEIAVEVRVGDVSTRIRHGPARHSRGRGEAGPACAGLR